MVIVRNLFLVRLESEMMFGVAVGILAVYVVSLFVHKFIGL